MQRNTEVGLFTKPSMIVAYAYYRPVNLSILFSTGGWVLKRFIRLFPDKGFMINMWAVAGSAFMGICREAEDIFCKALARP